MASDAQPGSCTVDPATWSAWLASNFPSPVGTLRVQGSVRCPSAGWTCALSEVQPQGGDPGVILLELTCTPPAGAAAAAAAVMTQERVTFEKVFADQNDGPHQLDVRWEPPFSLRIERVV